MRRLMWFSIGFSAAAMAFACFLPGIAAVYMALLGGGSSIALLLWKRKYSAVTACVLLGFSVGILYCWGHDSLILSPARAYDGQSQWVKIEASDYAFQTDYGTGVDGRVELDGRSYRVRLYLDSDVSAEPGDVLSGRVRLRYTSDGGLKTATYHRGEGIFLLAYAEHTMTLEKAQEPPAKYFAARFRKTIADTLESIFPESTAFFTKALLLGDDTGVSFSDNIAFQKSGIRHIVAVSGLHVSILFSVLYFATGRRKFLTLFAGLPVLFLFAAVAGFTPSVVRACIMQALVILATAVDREYDPATALSFAVLAILAANPLTVTSASFQLSVGCMIGIFAFSQKLREYLYRDKLFGPCRGKSLKARIKRWIVASLSVSVSAMTVTVPLCAWYFGMVSVIGVLTNMLTLWLLSFIFCGIILSAVLSALWLPAACITAYAVSVPIRFVLAVSRFLADIPFAVAYTESPYTVLWIVLSYCLAGLFFLSKKKQPLLLGGSIAVLYFLSLLLTWAEPRTDSIRLTVTDVGQGQCVLLQSKDSAYMIDCGGDDPEQTAEAALRVLGANGLTRLDGLILTHYDEDHAGAALYLLQVVDVDMLYLPQAQLESQICRQLRRQTVPICYVQNTMKFSCGTGQLSLYPAQTEAQGNESSMCILFRGEKCDILITGDRDWDGEHLLLQQDDIPDIEVLVAGHHGASTSTGLELLNAVKPETVLISVGADNLHGHPDPLTLTRLARMGCTVRRTDQEGTIIIRG